MSENIQDTEVIVIGAGISGLAAAKVLAEGGVDVLVLESRNRVGGRTWTVKNQKVGWVDLGGAYVGRTQNHLLRLIKELGLCLYPVNEVQHLVYYNAFTRGRGLFRNDQAPALSFWAALDVNHIFRLIDQMGEEISPAEPWKAVHAEEWDQMTFAEFVEANTTNDEARHFLRLFITLIITNEPYQSSLLWILWYIKQCGGTRAIFATTNGGQEFKVDGGTNQLTELLAARIGMGRVHLENAVYYLEQQQAEEGGHVLVKTLTGRTYTASYVIMATPPAVQQKIHYNPPLPAMRNQLIQRAPQGTVFKCIVYYERAFWKSQHMCGSLLLVGPDEEILIPYALDDSKPDGSYPAIVGFLPADKARKVASLTKEDRLKVICASYAKAFNCRDALQPIHYEEQNWSAEQYSGGCYTMTLGPGFLTRYGPYLRQPVGRLFYAGTECATEWSGYINGGIQAGERAARQVMAQLGRLNKAQQIDQIEPISLDYPPLPVQVSLFERYAPSARGLFRTVVLASVASISTVVAVIFKDHLGRLEEVVPFAWK